MRRGDSLNVRKLHFLLSSSGVRFGGAVDLCGLRRPELQNLFSADRVSAVDCDSLDPRTTFWKNVCTRRGANEAVSPSPSSAARMNEAARARALTVMTTPSAYTNLPAEIREFENLFKTATVLAQARRLWCYRQTLLPIIRHGRCSPRISASFATLREQVKDEEDEEESRERDPRASDDSRYQRQDADTSVKRTLLKDSESISSFGRIEPDGVQGKELGTEYKVSHAWSEAGWTREEVWNWPNSISMARLLSGPVLAWMILQEMWNPALIGLIVAGVSDWLDGYIARRMGINSVLGSYLDPVADKVLVGSVALSMAYAGLLHPALVGLVVARDGVLMGGAFVYRAYSLRWQWRNWREFFRINVGGAGKVEPLFISKVNTVLQLGLIGLALGQPALSIEDTYSLVPLLSWSVAGTTTISWACYVHQYLKNPDCLAALRHMPQTNDKKPCGSEKA